MRIFGSISVKMLQNTRKLGLAVCGSFPNPRKLNLAVCGTFCGGKLFSVIFVPFHRFYQKKLFSSNQNFPKDLPLFKLVEKILLSV